MVVRLLAVVNLVVAVCYCIVLVSVVAYTFISLKFLKAVLF